MKVAILQEMRLESLHIEHYRNISKLDLVLHPKLTILAGNNGMGKTNVLEAIHLLSFPRSFRGSKDTLLVKWGEEHCRIEGRISFDESPTPLSLVYFYNRQKKLLVDGKAVQGTDFVGKFLSILFAPEEVNLLGDSPGNRRAFIDAHLSQLSTSYFYHLLHYNKVIKQRNKLLSKGASRDELLYWDDQQVLHGSFLLTARSEAFRLFNEKLQNLRIDYKPSFVFNGDLVLESFQEKQSSILERERIVGHSLIGPHRDDWSLLEIGDSERDLGVYGSRGEQRLSVIQLKQVESNLLHSQTGQRAVLLLDDVLSELDASNQGYLLQTLGEQQTVITTASLSDVPQELLSEAFVYMVEEGRVSRAT